MGHHLRSRALRHTRRSVVGAVLAACALAAAACGSATEAGKESSAVRTPQSEAASRAVARLEKRPSRLVVPPLPHRPTPGKQIDYVSCGLPVCIGFGAYIKAAAKAVGWRYKLLNAGETPQTIATAYSQAVADHPAGVIGSGGLSPTLFVHQLAQLHRMHVPVVLASVDPAKNVTATLADGHYAGANGREMADWILDHSHGHDAHVAIFTTPETPVYAAAHAAIKRRLTAPACVRCTVSTYSFPESDIGQQLPNEVVSYLNRHPDISYLFFDFSNEVDGVPAALIVGGISGVNIVTTDITATEGEYLVRDQMSAIAGLPWPEMYWGAVNVVLNADQGQPTSRAVLDYPHMILDAHNLISRTEQFPLVADYRQIYRRAWHVG